MKFTLDASKWRCGSDHRNGKEVVKLGLGETSLLNKKEYQCCVGQFLEQCDVPRDTLHGAAKASQVNLSRSVKGATKRTPFTYNGRGWQDDSRLADQLYGVNDDTEAEFVPGSTFYRTKIRRTVRQKIAAIRRLLKKHGHSLRVVNLQKALKAVKK